MSPHELRSRNWGNGEGMINGQRRKRLSVHQVSWLEFKAPSPPNGTWSIHLFCKPSQLNSSGPFYQFIQLYWLCASISLSYSIIISIYSPWYSHSIPLYSHGGYIQGITVNLNNMDNSHHIPTMRAPHIAKLGLQLQKPWFMILIAIIFMHFMNQLIPIS